MTSPSSRTPSLDSQFRTCSIGRVPKKSVDIKKILLDYSEVEFQFWGRAIQGFGRTSRPLARPYYPSRGHQTTLNNWQDRIYVRPARKIKFKFQVQKSTWAQAIKSSSEKKYSLSCPVCKNAA